jgi:Fic family protein
MYNWQLPDWPIFKYQLDGFEALLMAIAENLGEARGVMRALPKELIESSAIDMMVNEALMTSAIEGEFISRADVYSSIRNNLGLNEKKEPIRDRRAGGISKVMIAVHKAFQEPLTEEMLFSWHRDLFESQKSIGAGYWRAHEEPMQVVSGPIGETRIHFEAPPSATVQKEMKNFIRWFNSTAPGKTKEIENAAVRSAIAHLYFESIHPFEDGNGRIGRAVAEKALYQGAGRSIPLSLSTAIEAKKELYYRQIQAAQRTNQITAWIGYFLETVLEAQEIAKETIEFVIAKTRFFDQHYGELSERQLSVLNRMLRDGPHSFEGGMSARKYIAITGVSKATATRDLQEMESLGILKRIGGGRSTRFEVLLS